LRPNLRPLAFASPRPRAVRSAMRRRSSLRGNAKHRKNQLGEIARGIKHRLGNRPQARPGALHVTGDNKKVGRIARQAVNCRDYYYVAMGEGGHQLS
jgi:hypothetical protein